MTDGSSAREKDSRPPLQDPEYVPLRTPQERHADGLDRRAATPLASHAALPEAGDRIDPLKVLQRQAEARVPDLVPLRYARMAASAFAFYRGGAAIMADDLSRTPTSGLRAQLCGDAHLLNFGMFDTPERRLVFGINDFDETLPGPVEWDLKRLAASVEIAGRDLGLKRSERRTAVKAASRAYRTAMTGFADMRTIDVWTTRLSAKDLKRRLSDLSRGATDAAVDRSVRKALRHSHLTAFDRLIEIHDDRLRFISDPPLLVPVEDLLSDAERERYPRVLESFLASYRGSLAPHLRTLMESYRFVGMARKVVGVGSVGMRAWVVLFAGRDQLDPLMLQLKEATASVLEPYAGASVFESPGRRVVEGQRAMQTASDSLLGWYSLEALDGRHHDFYVRQLWDGKSSIDVSGLSAPGLAAYADACGWTLARGHARSGDRIALAGYFDDPALDDALVEFAAGYADLNESDHSRLVAAIAAGEIEAAPLV